MPEPGRVVQRRLARLVDGEEGVAGRVQLAQHAEVAEARGLQDALSGALQDLKRKIGYCAKMLYHFLGKLIASDSSWLDCRIIGKREETYVIIC